MADPIRLRIQKYLTHLLETEVSVANGYNNDLAGKVFRGRLLFGSTDTLPLVSILEPPVPPPVNGNPWGAGAEHDRWELVLQGWTPDDKLHPTDSAHLLAQDVRRCLVKEKVEHRDLAGPPPLGESSITEFEIGQPVVRPPEEGTSPHAFFWLAMRLRIAERIGA